MGGNRNRLPRQVQRSLVDKAFDQGLQEKIQATEKKPP